MSDKIIKSPKIRFAEFTDAWEQRKLGDYIIPYNEVTTQNNQYPVFTSSRKGLFFQKDYYSGNQIASEDNTGYNIVPWGYFTYRHMSDDLVFKFNINNLAANGIVSTLYPVFTTTEGLDSRYLQYQLNEGEEFKRFAILQKQGGSRTYMYLSKLKNMALTMPRLDEQIKIGNFFKQLDYTITIHQRKLELLKGTKKSLLQKMFPKDGANVPEIRFAGFTDPWEQWKLGEVADLMTGYPFESKNFTEEGIPLIRGMNVKRGYLDMSDEICQYWPTSVGLESYLLKEGDILIQMDGALIGKSYAKVHSKNLPALLVQRVTRVRSEKVNCEFIYPYIQRSFLNHILAIKTETAVPHLSLNDIRSFQISIPSALEQTKIGILFENLDNLITLHQRELNSFKNLKISLLQQMFI